MVAQPSPLPQRMSVDEWRELERSSHDSRHEYINGWAYAMSEGSLAHSRIALNVCNALENTLEAASKPCFVYNSDAAVRLSSQHCTDTDPRWTYDANGPGEEIELASLNILLPMATLYRNAGVPERLNDSDGEV